MGQHHKTPRSDKKDGDTDVEFNFKYLSMMHKHDHIGLQSTRDLAGKEGKKGFVDVVNCVYKHVKYALGSWIWKEEFHLSEDAKMTLREVLMDPEKYFDTLSTDAVKKLAKFDTKLAEQIFEHLEDMYYSGRHTDTWEHILKK